MCDRVQLIEPVRDPVRVVAPAWECTSTFSSDCLARAYSSWIEMPMTRACSRSGTV
jgi:hypothetical protein